MQLLITAWETMVRYRPLFLNGIRNTLIVSLVGTVVGLFLGFGLAAMRSTALSEKDAPLARLVKRITRGVAVAYIEFVRGTPMIAQAVFLYYLLYPYLKWSQFVAGMIVVSLNTAAYMAEILRAGIQSIDRGQREAALSLGMTDRQIYSLVILPQAVRNSFPAIGNEFVTNIKDTSVLNAISVTELFFVALSVAGINYNYSASMLICIIIYFILTFIVTRILALVEKQINRPRGSNPRLQQQIQEKLA